MNPEERSTEELLDYGIINIDKPPGPTSHQVSAYVQKILGIKKSGHSGTLDPGVTGSLPVALGRSTKVVQAMLSAGKEYIAIMHLHHPLDPGIIHRTFKKMTGKIKQLPPKISAVKRQWRYRRIYEIEVIEIDGQDVLFRISCEAGTYIRKYIHDFGVLTGVGAHMVELRRTKAGNFDESTLVTLQQLTDAMHFYKEGDDTLIRKYIQPVEKAVELLPKVYVIKDCLKVLSHGLNPRGEWVDKSDKIEPDQFVAVMYDKELIGFGRAILSNSKFEENKDVVKLEKVFIKEVN